MYSLGEHFKCDKSRLFADEKAIIKGPKYRITVLTERLIRIEYQENGRFIDEATMLVRNRKFPVPSFNVQETEVSLEIKTKYFHLIYEKSQPILPSDNNIKYLTVKMNSNGNVWYPGHPESNNFMGSGNDILDNKTNFLNKGLYSLDGFMSLDDSSSYILDDNGLINNLNIDKTDIYLFMYDRDYGYAIQDYFLLTSLPSFIPRYALGNWWSKEFPYSDNDMRQLVNRFKEENIPLSVFLIDKNWSTLNSNFTFNPDLIANPGELFQSLHNLGVFVGLYLNPMYGIKPTDTPYEEARKYLSPLADGTIPCEAHDMRFVDVFLKLVSRPIENLGVDFYWNDYEGDNISKWILNNYLYLDEYRYGNKRPLIMARNSHIAPHRYPIVYSGKTINSWEMLSKIPFYNINFSNIGVSFVTTDVGGFESGIEDPDLYLRSVQLGVFSPIFRFHTSSSYYYKREPWKWDSTVKNIARNYMRLRHELIPYLYTESYKYAQYGTLMFQPFYYLNPNIYQDLDYRNEYFLGNSLFVVPLVKPKIPNTNYTKVRFMLPSGIWYNIFTGKSYSGDKEYNTLFRTDEYPVFAAKGTILVKNGDDYPSTMVNPTNLNIEIYPGKNNMYELYEDDGITNEYINKKYLKTAIEYSYKEKEYIVIIKSVEGRNDIVPVNRNYKIKFKNMNSPRTINVTQKSEPIAYKSYRDNLDFIIELTNIPVIGQINISCIGEKLEIINPVNQIEEVKNLIGDLQIPTDYKDHIETAFTAEVSISERKRILNDNKPRGLSNTDFKIVEEVLNDYFVEKS